MNSMKNDRLVMANRNKCQMGTTRITPFSLKMQSAFCCVYATFSGENAKHLPKLEISNSILWISCNFSLWSEHRTHTSATHSIALLAAFMVRQMGSAFVLDFFRGYLVASSTVSSQNSVGSPTQLVSQAPSYRVCPARASTFSEEHVVFETDTGTS